MPAGTEPPRPKGLHTATTQSPTRTSSTSPQSTDGNTSTASTLPRATARPAENDARRYRAAETEGIAHGHNPVTNPHLIGIAPVNRRQLFIRLDLQQGNVRLGIGADQRCGQIPSVRKAHTNVVRLVDDVIVGDDVAFRVDDEAGTHALARAVGRRHLLPLGPLEHVPEL